MADGAALAFTGLGDDLGVAADAHMRALAAAAPDAFAAAANACSTRVADGSDLATGDFYGTLAGVSAPAGANARAAASSGSVDGAAAYGDDADQVATVHTAANACASVFIAAFGFSLYPAGSVDGTACYGHIPAIAVMAAANARAFLCIALGLGRYVAAIDGNVAAVALIAAADSRSGASAGCLDVATVDGDPAAVFGPVAADTCPVSSAGCLDATAVDGDSVAGDARAAKISDSLDKVAPAFIAIYGDVVAFDGAGTGVTVNARSSAVCPHDTAGNYDVADALVLFGLANARGFVVAGGRDLAAVDFNAGVAALLAISASDAGALFAALGFDVAAVDDDCPRWTGPRWSGWPFPAPRCRRCR